MENLYIIVDGSNFLYRAYYSTVRVNLRNSKNVPTGATKVYINMLNKIIKQYPNSPLVVVFDAHSKSFRNELYSDYKNNRKPMPDDLAIQVDNIKNIIKEMGIPVLSLPNVEADDVIGSFAKVIEESGNKLLIASGDKDLTALVTEKVQVIDTMNNVIYDAATVENKFGVCPKMMRDFLALKGDAIDNIPGMSGIGDKTACLLLNEFGSIENIKLNLDKIATMNFRGAKTFSEKFISQQDIIELSIKLATIKTDVIIPLELQELHTPISNSANLLKIFKELEFKELITTELLTANNNEELPLLKKELQYSVINKEDDLDNLFGAIKKKGACIFDICVDINKDYNSLVGMAFSVDNKCFYIPIAHNMLDNKQLSKNILWKYFKDLFASKEVLKIGYDIKQLIQIFEDLELTLCTPYKDIMLSSYVCGCKDKTDISFLSDKYCNHHFDSNKLFTSKSKLYSDIEVDVVASYMNEKLSIMKLLHSIFSEKIEKDSSKKDIYNKVEIPFIQVLHTMEKNGVLLDLALLEKQRDSLKLKISDVEQKIYYISREIFNINSPKQVGNILFNTLNIPYPKKKSKTDSFSTSEDILSLLAPSYEVPRLILEYRKYSKLLNTYIEKLPTMVNPKTNRIHSSFNQVGTVTGRLSSANPNLQNIPIRTQEGSDIRKAFIAPKGRKIIAADYSQIELRIIAHMSNDKNMIKAFLSGCDIHTETASQMYGIDKEQVTQELRRAAKAINFGLMYGMSAFGLSKQLGIDTKVANVYIEKYFENYPCINKYILEVKDELKNKGYVHTFSGRKIEFNDYSNASKMVQNAIERAAINAPMQGGAAEIIKMAMIKVQNWIDSLNNDSIKMLLQVHDELVFEVDEKYVDEYSRMINEIMTSIVELKVPLVVSIGVGDNWYDAHN